MQKIKILFCLMNLNVGGISKACCDLVNSLANDYDIDVLAFEGKGALANTLSPNINILETNNYLKILSLSQSATKKMGIGWFFIRGLFALISRVFGNKAIRSLCIKKYKNAKEYDFAISYAQNASNKVLYGGVPELILNRITAKTKIQYIHDDFLREEVRCQYNLKLYNCFNKIITLSKPLGDRVSFYLPKKDIISIPNIILEKNIIELSKEKIQDVAPFKDEIIFLTTARLSKEKGIERAIESFSRIKIKRDFKWIIIGDGNEMSKINDTIKKYNFENNILLLGKKDNPYPYYLIANYYLMCSFNEAFPVTVDESHILGLPVIMTKYTSFEYQKMPIDYICENDSHSLTKVLEEVLSLKPIEKEYEKPRSEIKKRNEMAIHIFHSLFKQ